MKIYFVRHGKPDYETDSLTELGKKQAKELSKRMMAEKIDKIYSSSLGRAVETATPTAKILNKEITKLDFMREIHCRRDQFSASREAITNGINRDSREYKYYLSDDISYGCYKFVSTEFDKWLESFGIVREGNRYREKEKNDERIMLVSHSGASSVVLSHILDIPFMTVCGRMKHQNYTAVSVVDFEPDENGIIIPTLCCFNDYRHIEGLKD